VMWLIAESNPAIKTKTINVTIVKTIGG